MATRAKYLGPRPNMTFQLDFKRNQKESHNLGGLGSNPQSDRSTNLRPLFHQLQVRDHFWRTNWLNPFFGCHPWHPPKTAPVLLSGLPFKPKTLTSMASLVSPFGFPLKPTQPTSNAPSRTLPSHATHDAKGARSEALSFW